MCMYIPSLIRVYPPFPFSSPSSGPLPSAVVRALAVDFGSYVIIAVKKKWKFKDARHPCFNYCLENINYEIVIKYVDIIHAHVNVKT